MVLTPISLVSFSGMPILWAFYASEFSTASLMGRKQKEVQEIPGTFPGKSALWNFLAMRLRFEQCQLSKKKKVLQWGQPLRGPFLPVSPGRYEVPGKGRRWYFGLPPCTTFWLPNLATPSSRICLLLPSLTSLHTYITSGLLMFGHHPSWFYPSSYSSHDTAQWCLLCGALLAPPWAQGSWLLCSQCNVFLLMSPYCTVMHWCTCLSPQFDCAVLKYKD